MTGRQERGFTLVEIVIAIVLLGGTLVVLIGLQSSVVRKSLRDRKQQEAMLIARSIMSKIEIAPEEIGAGDRETTAVALLQRLEMIPIRDSEYRKSIPEDLRALLRVEEIEIPLPNSDPVEMDRVYLKLYWGDQPDEQLETVYFKGSE